MDNFGDRMKMHENKYRAYLMTNLPIFVRVDGKSFHTYTRGMNKPFDFNLASAFWSATLKTCHEIGHVEIAYWQSDEVTFLLNGWKKIETEPWLGGNVQKITSVISSIFTDYFNCNIGLPDKRAYFDARTWTVPLEEIENVLRWRQFDAKKNSISMLAQSLYSPNELHKINSADKIEKMQTEHGIDWHILPEYQKWGSIFYNKKYQKNGVIRSKWTHDNKTPLFVDSPDYINNIIRYRGLLR